MSTTLAILAAIGAGYFILKKRDDVRPGTEIPEREVPESMFPWPEDKDVSQVPVSEITERLPVYQPGKVFHHKVTGEKIEVLIAPEIVNGEYKIQWPDGSIGYIHESSFKEFFE